MKSLESTCLSRPLGCGSAWAWALVGPTGYATEQPAPNPDLQSVFGKVTTAVPPPTAGVSFLSSNSRRVSRERVRGEVACTFFMTSVPR
jgi:hypothetical protein